MSDGSQNNGKLPLDTRHIDYLNQRGVNDEAKVLCRFASVDAGETQRILNWKRSAEQLGRCLGIPYFTPDGSRVEGFARVRPDHPRAKKDKPGEFVKFEQPINVPLRLYFPPNGLAPILDATQPLLITEGEVKAVKAAQDGFGCIGLAGVSGWSVPRQKGPDGKRQGERRLRPDFDVVPLVNRKVYIAFDSDATTKKAVGHEEKALTRALQAAGATVYVLRLPAGSDGAKVGLDDYLCVHGADALRQLIEKAQPALDTGGRPVVWITTEEHEVVSRVTAALAKDDQLFQRQARLVRPVVIERPQREALPLGGKTLTWTYPDGLCVLRPAEDAFVRLRVTARCFLMARGEEDKAKPVHPPVWLAPGVAAVPGPIRAVEGLLPGPTLAADGRLIDKPGFDEPTGWYLARGLADLNVEKYPHRGDAVEAVAVLQGLIADFPFETDADRARWICLLLTACLRHLIGRTPLGLIVANVAGAGKTYLARLISIIAHGLSEPILMSWPDGSSLGDRGNEVRKRLASLLHEGASLAMIDNLPRGEEFSSAELDAFVTADAYHDRQLGRNDGARVGGPNRCLLLGTGNNVAPSGDTADRTLVVRLHSPHPNPRSLPHENYRIKNLERHAMEERAKYLGAVLTIWRAWIREGCPQPGGVSWGTFEIFVDSAVAAARWARLPDPLADRLRQIEELDREGQSLQTLLSLWRQTLGGEPLGCGAILERLGGEKETAAVPHDVQALREAISILGRVGRWPPSLQKLGKLLSGYEGRPVDAGTNRLTLRRDSDAHTKAQRYFVHRETRPVGSVAGSAGSCGYSSVLSYAHTPATHAPAHAHACEDSTDHYPQLPALPATTRVVEEIIDADDVQAY